MGVRFGGRSTPVVRLPGVEVRSSHWQGSCATETPPRLCAGRVPGPAGRAGSGLSDRFEGAIRCRHSRTGRPHSYPIPSPDPDETEPDDPPCQGAPAGTDPHGHGGGPGGPLGRRRRRSDGLPGDGRRHRHGRWAAITPPGQPHQLNSGGSDTLRRGPALGGQLPGGHRPRWVPGVQLPGAPGSVADPVSFKTGDPSKWFGYIANGSYFGAVNTAEDTGLVVSLPAEFVWTGSPPGPVRPRPVQRPGRAGSPAPTRTAWSPTTGTPRSSSPPVPRTRGASPGRSSSRRRHAVAQWLWIGVGADRRCRSPWPPRRVAEPETP